MYSVTTATLADGVHLLMGDKACIPLDWVQAKMALYKFQVLFHGLLEADHHLVEALHGLME